MMTKVVPLARIVVVVLSMSYAAFAGAQNSTPPAESATLPPGTVLSVDLSKSLDAKKSKPNDKIEAKTASDLLLHGQIVVPRNTKIVGHVTEAKAHSKSSPGSEIKFTFDRVLLKGGRELPLQLTVQAIYRPSDQEAPTICQTPHPCPAECPPWDRRLQLAQRPPQP